MKLILFHKKFFPFLCFLFACYTPLAQPTLPELIKSLNEASSAKKKADICFTISTRYSDRLKIDSGLFYANRIKELSEPISYETGIGQYHLAMAAVLFYGGRNDESEQNVLKSIEIFSRKKEARFLGRSYWRLATNQYSTHKVKASRKNYWMAIHYLVSDKDQSGSFRAYLLLARTYEKTVETDSAVYYYIKALEIAEQLNDDKRISGTACEVGECYLIQGELENANKYLRYGLKKRTPLSDNVGIRLSLEHYATTLILLQDFSRADSVIKEIELMNVSLNDAWGKMALNRIKGRYAFQQKNYQKSVYHLQEANSRIGELKTSARDVQEVAFLLGKAKFEMNEYNNAIPQLQISGKFAHELRYVFEEMEANRLLSKSFEKLGKPDSALQYFKNYSLLKDSVLSAQKLKNIIEITTRYETEKRVQEIKMLQKESEANDYLLKLNEEQLQKQGLESQQKTNQLTLVSKQNEINKLDASQKTLSLDNEKKENEKKQAKLKLLETEAAFQKLLVAKENQQKNLAYAGIAAILILGGSGLYRYTRRRQLQNQREVSNERLRISRELHDEVGSTLSGLAMYSHLAKQQIKASNTTAVEKSLNTMQQSAGEMVSKLNDIVWLVNPEKDSLQKLVERLEEYAVGVAMTQNIEVKINFPLKLSDLNVSVETRRNIYLFCKEAINNAVKYSGATLIELTMKELDNKKISIAITDNGKGFNVISIKKGNGLSNMQQRVEKMSGEYLLQSTPGQGTSVSLKCKIT